VTDQYATLGKILSDLDRCIHGRHRKDSCFDCPDGYSAGNPQLPPSGAVVGYDRAGGAYVVPAVGRSFAEPDAWRSPAPLPVVTTSRGEYGEDEVRALADVLADAHLRGIRYGTATLARVILDAGWRHRDHAARVADRIRRAGRGPLVDQHLPGCPAAFSDEGGPCRCDEAENLT
jgi:hypothetical protein